MFYMGYSAVSDFLFRKLIAKSLLVLFTSQILFPLFTLSEVFAADTTPPIITLSGASSIITPVGSVFTDPGATCIDDLDPSCNVIASGSVDTSMTGTYTITYDATDLAGNTATQLQRDVTVIDAPDTIPPTATVLYSTTGATNS